MLVYTLYWYIQFDGHCVRGHTWLNDKCIQPYRMDSMNWTRRKSTRQFRVRFISLLLSRFPYLREWKYCERRRAPRNRWNEWAIPEKKVFKTHAHTQQTHFIYYFTLQSEGVNVLIDWIGLSYYWMRCEICVKAYVGERVEAMHSPKLIHCDEWGRIRIRIRIRNVRTYAMHGLTRQQ